MAGGGGFFGLVTYKDASSIYYLAITRSMPGAPGTLRTVAMRANEFSFDNSGLAQVLDNRP